VGGELRSRSQSAARAGGTYASTFAPKFAGEHVLDVARGTGRWLERLLRAGASSGAGADLSAAMLRAGLLKIRLRGRLARAACVALPFQSEVADLLVCSFALSHIDDLVPVGREFARVTKPDADVFIRTFIGRLREGLADGLPLSQRVLRDRCVPTFYPRSAQGVRSRRTSTRAIDRAAPG
jgi:ubiquinone/menaquinone biosynthesis C-methylase UbiE